MATTKTYMAPAKVNLFLKIIGKRDDGYHELLSLMTGISLYDELVVSVDDCKSDNCEIIVETDDPSIGQPKDNLCFKAAKLFLDHCQLKKSVKIDLKKNIPHGAGLGGGSSDGAYTLMALNELTRQNLPEKVLLSLAAELGSDVPFFMLKSPGVARGRGEKLEKTRLCELNMIIVKPNFPVSTKSAYDGLDLTKTAENNTLLPFSSTLKYPINEPEEVVKLLSNDLEAVVLKKYPRIGEIKKLFIDIGAIGSLMSGSGSCVFSIFKDGEAAKSALEKVTSSLEDNEKAFLVKTLS